MFSDLERLNETWNRAWLEKDGAIVDRLMANEYVYIAPNGQVLDRQTIVKIIQSANYQLYNGKRTEVVIKPVGKDAAAIVHRWQGEGTFEGKSFKDDHRCTMLCARRGTGWQIILEHCSPNNK
ncbi:MAG: nuclear transport factor 2 family protein [Acidobacteriota bacterium]|nr:nuclear transport factor 2 family protein [Acidobacteriota bacterium]